MQPPESRSALATDGETRIRTMLLPDGTLSIRLSSGAVSIVAAVSAENVEFLRFATPEDKANAA